MAQLISIRNKLEGRARIEVPLLYRSESFVDWVERGLSSQLGIRRVTGNHRTAHLLVLFDAKKTTLRQITRMIADLLKEDPEVIQRQYYRRLTSLRAFRNQITPPKPWYNLTKNEVISLCSTSGKRGLTSKKAKQRIKLYGSNQLPITPNRSEFEIFSRQFRSLPVALLIGSSAVSTLTGGLADAVVIMSVVFINSYLGYLMESSAERTVNTLTQTKHPKSLVIRDHRNHTVPIEDITIGDLLTLSPGTQIPADARILKADHLQIDESILTGESLPVSKTHLKLNKKRLPLSGRINMAFRGTTVTSGSGLATVVSTGESTELGNIQSLMGASSQPETPLQRYLNALGERMVFVSLSVSGAVLILGSLRGFRFVDILKTAISLAVAAIPEGLPTVATTTLARGIKNLEKHKILIRHLEAVEAFGNIDVICLDKTGTLTLNQMTVVKVHTIDRQFDISQQELIFKGKATKSFRYPELLRLIQIVTLCNEAQLDQRNPEQSLKGSATELALLRFAIQTGTDPLQLKQNFPLKSVRYRSEHRRSMTTYHPLIGGGTLLATKGSPHEVLTRCRYYMKDGALFKLTEKDRVHILNTNNKLAEQALRVLGVAFKEPEDTYDLAERNMIWLGLIGMADPIRPGIHKLIEQFHHAGIRTIMITGDQSATALAVGKTLKLSEEHELEIVDSTQLETVSLKTFSKLASRAHIFSRVSPSHKLRIVQALQRSGRIVAMTGDGINDGPALKIADIGIAMGGNGSDTARKVADVVLTQDNLATLIFAIQEGRNVHEDIRKAVAYIVSQNLSEMLFTFLSILFGLGEPLTPMQLLWVNLVTDIFPELALSQDPPEYDLLDQHPYNPRIPLVTQKSFRKLLMQSFILTAASLGSYYYGIKRHGVGPRAKTLGFLTLNTASLLHTLSSRSEKISVFDPIRPPENHFIPLSIGVGFFAEMAAILVPRLRSFLKTEQLSLADLCASGASSIIPFFLIEAAKFTQNHMNRTLSNPSKTGGIHYGAI